MASLVSRRPEPCAHENCGSRRFHVGDDGFTYCDRGHQQSERGTVIAEDTGEVVLAGRKTRRKDSDAESTTSKASGLSSPRAFEHYLLCIQLVLRKQLRWLIEVQRLPEELEALVRDLWALRLRKLQNRVSYDSETEAETQSQFFSSQSEGETSATESSRRSRSRSRSRPQSRTRIEGTPTLSDTLVLCFIGTLLLREPVTVADVYSWANSGELLYYRASKEVPLGMRERLPPTYQDLLEPNALGEPEKLHHSVLKLLSCFHDDLGMALPPINHPVILYKWMKELTLPIEVFSVTSRLARLLNLDFGFKLDSKVGTKDVVLRYPEARLMALLVAATKLLFPFDTVKRSPMSPNDLSALAMHWPTWAEMQSPRPKSGEDGEPAVQSLTYQEAMKFSESDVLGAADHQLDHYMDWVERNIASEDIRERGRAGKEADFRRHLFRMFPVDGRSHAPTGAAAREQDMQKDEVTERLRRVQSALKLKRIVEPVADEDRDADRIGSFHRRYRTKGDLEGVAKVFYAQSATLAGLSLDGMVRAVFLVERQMQAHEERARQESDG